MLVNLVAAVSAEFLYLFLVNDFDLTYISSGKFSFI